MDTLAVKAYAKVNLTLEVLGRRPDGYHQVATVLQTVSLADDILLMALPKGIEVECSEPSLQGPANLAFQAASLLQKEMGVSRGVRIVVHKDIPIAGGLGGGSSDAAATLKGLVRLWGLSLSREHLSPLAARLGSDVPFFLWGGTALAQGRGEHITPLPSLQNTWFVLLCPPLGNEGKTPRLFRMLKPQHWSDGSHSCALVDALRAGRPLCDAMLYNTFETVAWEAFPGLEVYWRGLEEATGSRAHLSGAGPSIYALAPSLAQAEECARTLRTRGWRAWAVSSVGPEACA